MYAKSIIIEYERSGNCEAIFRWRKSKKFNSRYDLKLLGLFLDVNKSIIIAKSLENYHLPFDPKNYLKKLTKLTAQEEGEDSWQAAFLLFMQLNITWD
jgi:hypothetical protein